MFELQIFLQITENVIYGPKCKSIRICYLNSL